MLSLRLLCGAIGIWRWRRAVEILPESIVPLVERLCVALSMKMPSVRVCRRVAEAVAVGLFKPMILLPAARSGGVFRWRLRVCKWLGRDDVKIAADLVPGDDQVANLQTRSFVDRIGVRSANLRLRLIDALR